MSILKRILILIYVIASFLGIGLLVGQWLQWAPALSLSGWLIDQGIHVVVMGVLLSIAGVGLLVLFIWGIISPRRSSQFIVKRDGGSITIAKQSIESVMRYVVTEHRGLKTIKIKIRILGRKQQRIRAAITVDPGARIQLEELGASLQAEVLLAIQKLIGEPAEKVEIHFKRSDIEKADYSLQTLREAASEQEPVQNV